MMNFLAIYCQNARKPIIELVSAATGARSAQILGNDEVPCHAVLVLADVAHERHTSRAQNDKSNPRRQARNDAVRGSTFRTSDPARGLMHLVFFVVRKQFVECQCIDAAVARPQHHQCNDLELFQADNFFGQGHGAF